MTEEVAVPLSEHEQRLLSQMEQQLLADDPRFASTMRGGGRRASTGRRLAVGGVALVVGLLLLVLAVVQKSVLLGVVAFVVMLAGAGYAFAPPRRSQGPVGVVGSDGRPKPFGAAKSASTSSGSFMQRMEQRWHRRRDEGWR
ncbi:MAG TPA: DUF3040 domain-containing protein [Actinomycetales bacterium]|nr:DUF3040 domain-containing protein [Actinomycetales bacterium]